jgi:hypothetical protein
MDDCTRLPIPGLDSAGVFAGIISEWLQLHGPLFDAILAVRREGTEPEALAALLATRAVRQMTAEWELWDLWAWSPGFDGDRRLAAYLGEPQVARARFALWG